jgi:hypothetical protein
MNKSVHRRIAVVESQAVSNAAAGCATCRHYAGIVLMDDDGNLSRPERCPECGRDVPIYRLLHIVGVPLEMP